MQCSTVPIPEQSMFWTLFHRNSPYFRGIVYYDNGDHIYGNGDLPVSGIKMKIYLSANLNCIKYTTTDVRGEYFFYNDLINGTINAEPMNIPSGYTTYSPIPRSYQFDGQVNWGGIYDYLTPADGKCDFNFGLYHH